MLQGGGVRAIGLFVFFVALRYFIFNGIQYILIYFGYRLQLVSHSLVFLVRQIGERIQQVTGIIL